MAASTFHSEDEEAQHCLSLLRDGTPQEKIGAREQLAAIFFRRGMYEEATELYEANVRAGVRTPELFKRLSDAYRRIGEPGAADAALAEAGRLREAEQPPAPVPAPAPPPSLPARPLSTALGSPAPEPAAPESAPPGRLPDDAPNKVRLIQFPSTPATERLPAQAGGQPSVTTRLPAASRYDPDADALPAEASRPRRPRRRAGPALPGPLLVISIVLFVIVVPVTVLALLVVNPLALYLEGRPAGPTVDVRADQPARLKVAAGASASWYLQSGRSVSGLWATPGLELTLDQELDGAGSAFAVTAPRPQSWGETITIVERRGQGRANQDTMLLATFNAPAALPPSGTVLPGRIVGQVTAPRLSESSQFNTTAEGVDLAVQLVVVSVPELWLDWFLNSLRMFFLEDRWLLVTIGALLTWCVLAGSAAIMFRARRR